MVAESVLGGMRRARLLSLLGLVLLVTVLLAGCGANAGADPLLAAKVNGHGITLAQYQQMLAAYRATNARNNVFTDWRSVSQRNDLATTQQQVLDILINIELLREQLNQQHVTVTQKAIQTARTTLNDQIAQSRKQLERSPDPALTALLDALTPDVVEMLSEQDAMQTALQEKGKVPAVHLRGIETKDQQTAQQLQQQAESGSDFGALARANSLNKSTSAQGGELGTAFIGEIPTAFGRAILGEIPYDSAATILDGFASAFDKAVFAHGAHPGKYLILPLHNNYWLFELTNLGLAPLSTLDNSQAVGNVYASWLAEVVRPSASIEEYLTIG